jgi:hypothetical protein
VLLHNRQALELLRDNIQCVHRPTATTNVLDLISLLATIMSPAIAFLKLLIPLIFQASRPP